MIKKYCIVFLIFVCPINGYGKVYKSQHFVIHSDLDSRYIKIIQENIESYYCCLEKEYFGTGGKVPITFYYSKTRFDTQRLYGEHGITGEAHYGLYSPDPPTLYSHQYMDDGSLSGLGTLFHEITHHFVNQNYRNVPTWFDEGLATILGEQTRIVKGQLDVGHPNPWREQILKNMIENGYEIDVKHLLSLSYYQDFHKDKNNYHPTRALFYWLYDTGKLKEYMQNVKENDYSLSVLEKTVGKSYKQINAELLTFVKKNCFAGAFLKDGSDTQDRSEKKQFYLKALELKPDYKAAKLNLGSLYFYESDYDNAEKYLREILDASPCREYPEAATYLGHCYYKRKNYAEAVKYYNMAAEYSEYTEYGYQLYYWIGYSYHFLRDYSNAKKYHQIFLEKNWEPERTAKMVESSEKYVRLELDSNIQNSED